MTSFNPVNSVQELAAIEPQLRKALFDSIIKDPVSKKKIAQRLGVGQATISRFLCGRAIGVVNLMKIYNFLAIDKNHGNKTN